jgi:hypothetical protein
MARAPPPWRSFVGGCPATEKTLRLPAPSNWLPPPVQPWLILERFLNQPWLWAFEWHLPLAIAEKSVRVNQSFGSFYFHDMEIFR